MQQSVVYCIYKYFFCSSIKMRSIEFLLQQGVVYCISIAIHRNASSTRSRANALHCISPPAAAAPLLQLTDGKKTRQRAVLSNFRSQYFRYLAAKCDLNTPALCFGWAQIYTHPLQHLFKNWLKADSDSPFVFLSFLPLSKKLKHLSALAINI